MALLEYAGNLVDTPDSGGGCRAIDSNLKQLENPRANTDSAKFVESLTTEAMNLNQIYDYEAKLRESGYLVILEEMGVVRRMPRNPNPHTDFEAHLLWVLGHKYEVETYMQEVERREEILRHLYIGSMLGNMVT